MSPQPRRKFGLRESLWLLGACCAVSIGIHLFLLWKTPPFTPSLVAIAPPKEIEVTLEPLPTPEPKVPEPAKPKPAEPKKPKPPVELPKRTTPVAKAVSPRRNRPPSSINEPRPIAKTPEPGGILKNRRPTPLPLGAPSQPVKIAAAPPQPAAPVVPNPELENEQPAVPNVAPNRRVANAPRFKFVPKDDSLAGGGAPAPSTVPSGTGGAPGPVKPDEDVVFNGGGAGGINLPKVAPRIGGGGGRSILTAKNDLATDVIPDDTPGLGPGRRGGQGTGSGGGVGAARGTGIGVNPNGKVALGTTLRTKPGAGIGAGSGDGIGTNAPGGGKGTGSELPGTGGTGSGYGRGSGVGIGNGFRPGIAGGGIGGAGRGGVAVVTRGVPFGDITGLLKGDPNGGGGTGGGPGGRGAGLGGAGGGGGPVAMVYLLDVSGSMRRGNKIGKAKDALKKAIRELRPGDSFNVIGFDGATYALSNEMQKVTPQSIEEGLAFVDVLRMDIRPGTNLYAALERAFSLGDKVSHIFVLSDGEPRGGIEDPRQLRAWTRQQNHDRFRIITLALGLGDRFEGVDLLRALAEENGGKFDYVNLGP